MEANSDAKVFTFSFVNASETIAIGSALPIVCVIVVALRFFTRTRQVAHVGLDDWLILAGAVTPFTVQRLEVKSDDKITDMYDWDGRLPPGWFDSCPSDLTWLTYSQELQEKLWVILLPRRRQMSSQKSNSWNITLHLQS